MSIERFIKKIQESESYKKFKDDLEEASMTGMVAGYDTPKAFSPSTSAGKMAFDKKTKSNAEKFGYKIVEKSKRKNSIDYETFVNNGIKKPVGGNVREGSTYKAMMDSLTEASYKSYKSDKSRTTNEKINYSIKELNQALMQVERAVNHASRLKTEMAVDQRSLWRSSHNRLVKIGERLNRIGKKINELGA